MRVAADGEWSGAKFSDVDLLVCCICASQDLTPSRPDRQPSLTPPDARSLLSTA